MDDLPDLPLENIFSYLSLEERIKARAVSRRWCKTIDSMKAKALCFSECPVELALRWMDGVFAKNFIRSVEFELFFDTFGRTILSNLKHLRICGFYPTKTAFAQAMKSFGRLEELDLLRFRLLDEDYENPDEELTLSLPMLRSIRLESYRVQLMLVLDAPKLQRIKIFKCFRMGLLMKLVHVESVESVITEGDDLVAVKKMKNLKHLYTEFCRIHPALLTKLKQLKEINLDHFEHVDELFEQKRRLGRADLKIYARGFLVDGPNDLGIVGDFAQNHSRLASEIHFLEELKYSVRRSFLR